MKHYEYVRTTQQNKAYWGLWLRELSVHTGHCENELHQRFKQMFLPSYENIVTGEVANQTTRLLTMQEFSIYLERIRAFAAAEWGITLTEI